MQQYQPSNVIAFAPRNSQNETNDQPNRDRRQQPRRRVIKAATVTCPGNTGLSDCMIRNLSADGARLITVHDDWLPDSFELLIDADGTEAECEVIRRDDHEVTVRFIATA